MKRKDNPMTNQSDIISNCCNKPMTVSEADEGTCCYVCSGCMRACDPKQEDIVAEKVKEFRKEYGSWKVSEDGYNYITLKRTHLEEWINDALTKVAEESRKEIEQEYQSKINMICLGILVFKESEKHRLEEEKQGLQRRDGGPYFAAFSLIDRIKAELEFLTKKETT